MGTIHDSGTMGADCRAPPWQSRHARALSLLRRGGRLVHHVENVQSSKTRRLAWRFSGGLRSLEVCVGLASSTECGGLWVALWVRVVLWAILVFGLVVSFLPGVSLSGHIGGLALGALFGFLVPVRTGDPAQPSMQGIRQTNGPSKNRARRGLKKKPLTFPPKALVEDQTRGYTSSSFGSTSSMVTGLFEY